MFFLGCEPAQAEAFLELSGGSLAVALNMHMEGVQVPAMTSTGSSQTESGPAGPSAPFDEEDPVRAPIPQKRETLIEAGYEGYPIHKPLAGASGSRQSRVRTVFDGFRNFSSEASQ